MSDPFIGEIKMFAGNYAPRYWAYCDGQIISVASNQALASLLGNFYGGDGRTTFALPDMRGRIPVHFGQGPGLSNRVIGQRIGAEVIRLTSDNIPSHNHNFMASLNTAGSIEPIGVLGTPPEDSNLNPKTINLYSEYDSQHDYTMNNNAITAVGGNDYHENRMPYFAINFIICLLGTYPQRND